MSAISFGKLRMILNRLYDARVSPRGLQIYANSTGEIRFDFTSQPTREVHFYLLEKGFILDATIYIYRPK